jgi:hypothetical protein
MKRSKKSMPLWFEDLKPAMKRVYLLLIGSIFVLTLLCHLILPLKGEQPSKPINLESSQILLSITGLGLCFLSMVFNQWALKPKRVAMAPLGDQEKTHIMSTFVISWILAWSCSIVGFSLAFISNQPSESSMFSTIAILIILSHPFTEGRVKRALNLA